MHFFLYAMGRANSENHYTYEFKLKKGPEINQFLAHQIQNFLRQDGVQTPKICRPIINLD